MREEPQRVDVQSARTSPPETGCRGFRVELGESSSDDRLPGVDDDVGRPNGWPSRLGHRPRP
jgi:hypothetical protein